MVKPSEAVFLQTPPSGPGFILVIILIWGMLAASKLPGTYQAHAAGV
jgi:hypothetical protein